MFLALKNRFHYALFSLKIAKQIAGSWRETTDTEQTSRFHVDISITTGLFVIATGCHIPEITYMYIFAGNVQSHTNSFIEGKSLLRVFQFS